jgi:cytochrome subunit of sulfide dehydrogenase
MNKTTREMAGLAAGLLLAGAACAEGVRSPSVLANTCAGCHGTAGASAGTLMPIIGGLDKTYVQDTLMAYKSGARDSTIMGRIAKGYSDLELKAIASYMAAQPWVSAPMKADRRLAAKGKAIHDRECETCHEDGGRDQTHEAPRIAGQWPDYTLLYLQECQDKGRRCAHPQMGKRVVKLSDEELQAMAQYYLSEQ